jgi:hypothetical protein
MRERVLLAATAIAFLGSVAVASAAELSLTTQQKQMIAQGVQTELAQPTPSGFMPRVGAAVPPALMTHQLPPAVTSQIPAARDMQFAKLDNNEVLLIDPKDKRVADIITSSGTTGAAPPASPRAPTSPGPRSPAEPR